ncbi:hypothetical protein HEB94_009657 [Actinopolymorpha pittospori]|uniref:Uncharacterized protein n=1 Tax=Actinopolymorpha pittospori TaxID=648752 RepID=A0A927N625_9ACTN|nr:hypothetical protein [Actinopolymorpha pittospori]
MSSMSSMTRSQAGRRARDRVRDISGRLPLVGLRSEPGSDSGPGQAGSRRAAHSRALGPGSVGSGSVMSGLVGSGSAVLRGRHAVLVWARSSLG